MGGAVAEHILGIVAAVEEYDGIMADVKGLKIFMCSRAAFLPVQGSAGAMHGRCNHQGLHRQWMQGRLVLIILYDLKPTHKASNHHLQVEIDLYPYATRLYGELDRLGIVNRLKEIPQLGVIKTPVSLNKTRFDYIILQLYLHQLIKNKDTGFQNQRKREILPRIVNSCFF